VSQGSPRTKCREVWERNVEGRVPTEARDQVVERDTWWVANRPAAPTAFRDELVVALRDLAAQPTIAAVVVQRGGMAIRRWLLPKTKCHLYYAVDEERGVIDVLAVWGARMGQLPPLAKGKL